MMGIIMDHHCLIEALEAMMDMDIMKLQPRLPTIIMIRITESHLGQVVLLIQQEWVLGVLLLLVHLDLEMLHPLVRLDMEMLHLLVRLGMEGVALLNQVNLDSSPMDNNQVNLDSNHLSMVNNMGNLFRDILLLANLLKVILHKDILNNRMDSFD